MSLLKKRYYFFDNDNPFSLLSEFDTIVDDILRKFNVQENGHTENLVFSYPPTNIIKRKLENGQVECVIQLLVPGYSKDELTVKLIDDSTIEIKGKKKAESKDDNSWYDMYEFKLKTQFTRKILVPNIQRESIESKLENGILTIKLLSGKRKNVEEIEIM